MYLWQLQVRLLGTHSCHCSWPIHKNVKATTTLVQIAHFLEIKTHTHTYNTRTTDSSMLHSKQKKTPKTFWSNLIKALSLPHEQLFLFLLFVLVQHVLAFYFCCCWKIIFA